MNGLESIKERLQQDFYVKSHPTWGKDDTVSKDVEWLTQRLERCEEALKEANTIIHDHKEARGYRERQVLEIADIIKEALKE